MIDGINLECYCCATRLSCGSCYGVAVEMKDCILCVATEVYAAHNWELHITHNASHHTVSTVQDAASYSGRYTLCCLLRTDQG